MPVDANNPLNKQDLNTIQTQLRALHDLIAAIQKAQQCGVDCTEHEQHRSYIVSELLNLKKAYFPDSP
jgi:hypothetical protein